MVVFSYRVRKELVPFTQLETFNLRFSYKRQSYLENSHAFVPGKKYGILLTIAGLKQNECTKMLYSETSYPDVMKKLSEEVRLTAIEITNDMLLDGDVRYNEDFVILIAIQKAQQLFEERSDLNLQ